MNTPISNEALELIGYNDGDENRKPTDKVFVGFNDSLTQAPLKNWLKETGITKHITYHCSRHTAATMLLTLGASIYVVSKILGHKSIKMTEIYAKIVDKKKLETVNLVNGMFDQIPVIQ